MMVSTIIRSSWCHFRNGCLRLINFLLQHWWSYPLLLTTATTTTVNDKESGSLVLSSFLDEQIQRAKKQANKQQNNNMASYSKQRIHKLRLSFFWPYVLPQLVCVVASSNVASMGKKSAAGIHFHRQCRKR